MKKLPLNLILILIIGLSGGCRQKKQVTPPPDLAKSVVWYQIFPERFNNGDTTNDPTPATIHTATDFYKIPEFWHITPWNRSL